jgi:carbonic anhydrase/acetyltransferase-like protein (isoleucine patch superfamily)
VGVPAKVVRTLTDEEQARIVMSATGYCERARQHQHSLSNSE